MQASQLPMSFVKNTKMLLHFCHLPMISCLTQAGTLQSHTVKWNNHQLFFSTLSYQLVGEGLRIVDVGMHI